MAPLQRSSVQGSHNLYYPIMAVPLRCVLQMPAMLSYEDVMRNPHGTAMPQPPKTGALCKLFAKKHLRVAARTSAVSSTARSERERTRSTRGVPHEGAACQLSRWGAGACCVRRTSVTKSTALYAAGAHAM